MRSNIPKLIENNFIKNRNGAYLNNAAVALLPLSVKQKMVDFLDKSTGLGKPFSQKYFRDIDIDIRAAMANLLNCKSTEIAFSYSTADAVCKIAFGLPFSSNDEILLSKQEFPSNRIPWIMASRMNKFKIKWYKIPKNTVDYTEYLLKNVTNKTKLIAVSSIQYLDGAQVNLKKIGNFCKERNIYFFVDGIQQIGAFKIDVKECNIDFLVGATHKWLISTIGLGYLYCKQKNISIIKMHQVGWRSIKKVNFTSQSLQLSPNAIRFESSSYSIVNAVSLRESLNLINKIGLSIISHLITHKANYLIEELAKLPAVSLSLPYHKQENRQSGILSFRLSEGNKIKIQKLAQKLNENKIICVERNGNIRFSPHFYTSEEELKRAIKVLKKLLLPSK